MSENQRLTNRQLSDRAHELGKELGVEVDTSRKNNEALTKLVESLEAQKAAKDKGEGDAGETPQLPGVSRGAVRAEPEAKPAEAPAPEPVKASEPEPKPEKTAEPKADKPAASEAPKGGYVVAKGKAITCKKGVIDQGQAVQAKDVHGGQDRLDELTAKGVLVKQ